MRRVATIIIAASCLVLAACDATWEDMTGYSYGPRCDRTTYVGAANGQFSYAQHLDMASAVDQWRGASAVPLQWVGGVDWTLSSLPMNSVLVEKGPIQPGIIGLGWPGRAFLKIDPSGYFDHGQIKLDPSVDSMRTPTDPSYSSGQTFRGKFAHEAGHALLGLGDMYDNDDGHPGLLMGRGSDFINEPALGDVIGAVRKGCRSPAEKDALVAQLTAQYG